MMFGKSKKLLGVVGALMVGAMVFAGCGADKAASSSGSAALEGKISASGSTALLPLLKPAQEDFQNKNAKVTVNWRWTAAAISWPERPRKPVFPAFTPWAT